MTRTSLKFLSGLLVVLCASGRGQEQPTDSTVSLSSPPRLESARVRGDTTALVPPPPKSPGLAMLLSAALPGAGQVYNESYWKAPLVAGLGVYFISEFLDNNRRTEENRAKYVESLVTSPAEAPGYRTLRDFYKDQRDAFVWYFVILYVLNIVDAYVDASLYGFDVSPILALQGRVHPGFCLRLVW